jgi:hypothetical protein
MDPQVLLMYLYFSARRLFIPVLCVIALSATGCLDAPHDNPYDPDNPNKAYLSVSVNELGSFDLQGATVKLVRDASIVQTDTSNEHGAVVFENIDPGIYYLHAEALYYSTVVHGPETLWADFEISRKIEMITLNFDDEMAGISSPRHISSIIGTWEIVEDHDQPQAHSTPNVYRGIDSNPEEIALALCDTATQYFLIEVKLKVDTSSTENWRAGIVFRYQNASNYRVVILSSTAVQCYSLIDGQIDDIRTVERELTAGVWYKLRAGRNQGDALIRINMDDNHLFTLYDNVFWGGKVGLFVSNIDDFDPAIVTFDDVSIDVLFSYTQ